MVEIEAETALDIERKRPAYCQVQRLSLESIVMPNGRDLILRQSGVRLEPKCDVLLPFQIICRVAHDRTDKLRTIDAA